MTDLWARNLSKQQAHVINKLGALGTGLLLHQYHVEPAVKRQPGFRWELVEQITLF